MKLCRYWFAFVPVVSCSANTEQTARHSTHSQPGEYSAKLSVVYDRPTADFDMLRVEPTPVTAKSITAIKRATRSLSAQHLLTSRVCVCWRVISDFSCVKKKKKKERGKVLILFDSPHQIYLTKASAHCINSCINKFML